MRCVTRRSAIRGTVGLVAAAGLARPHTARAATTTATVWYRGTAEEEDIAFRKMVNDYQKVIGNSIDYSIVPFASMRRQTDHGLSISGKPHARRGQPFICQLPTRNSRSTGTCRALTRLLVSEAIPMMASRCMCCASVMPFCFAAAVCE
jgi:hypothetical protein